MKDAAYNWLVLFHGCLKKKKKKLCFPRKQMVKPTKKADELNQSRLGFIDQQERKLSCHRNVHGMHQKSNEEHLVYSAQ